jgi:hypothetical protein
MQAWVEVGVCVSVQAVAHAAALNAEHQHQGGYEHPPVSSVPQDLHNGGGWSGLILASHVPFCSAILLGGVSRFRQALQP